MRTLSLLISALIFFTGCHIAAAAEGPAVSSERTTVSLLTEVDAMEPGKPFWAGLRITLPPHWHTYSDPSGDAGLPVAIAWELPEGFSVGPIHWPRPKTFKEAELTTYGYDDEVVLPVSITAPKTLNPGDTITLKARASILICKDVCIPVVTDNTVNVQVAHAAAVEAKEKPLIHAALAKDARPAPALIGDAQGNASISAGYGLGAVLLFALVGGLILNLMPCVFPVLSLKCLAVAKQGGISARMARLEGLAYTAGIMLCFALVAGALIVLQQGSSAVGWGFQMQSAGFVAFLALLLFLIGLNLSGLFDLPVLLGSAGAELAHEPSLKGSFFTGVLATLVATPCTAPFMASAVGYALSQPPLIALLVFEALALGLALPFLLVSFFPRLLRFMPKPGAWMESFKEFLAFPMYLSGVWLLWVLAQQGGANAVALALTAAVLMLLVLWSKRFFARDSRAYHIGATAAMVGLLIYVPYQLSATPGMFTSAMHDSGAEAFNQDAIERYRKDGRGVFVNATAAWCITCQLNYHSTINTYRVRRTFEELNIVYMEADWTRQDAEITAFLAQFGAKGVPLYVYYAPGKEPVVLPQLLTPDIVLSAVSAQ